MKWIVLLTSLLVVISCQQQLPSSTTEPDQTEINKIDPAASAASIDQLLDNWHKAAATADADAFFGAMTEDCIYLGTDATEKWKRDELRTWAAKAFERETAWAFTPHEREVYVGSDDLAWFDEKLDTWMGECRGTGVVVSTADGWKLKHYNLAVTISNDKIKEFKAIEQEKSFSQNSH